MTQYINKGALVAEIKTLLSFYLKEIEDNKEGPWTMDIAKRDILQEIISFIDTLEVKEVQEEHCTETEFREIEIFRTKLSDIAKAIYYHEGKENLTVERIREIVQDCCFELIDLKKPKQEEHASSDLEKEIDNYISSNFFGSQTTGFFANRTKEEPNDRDIAFVPNISLN